MLDGSGSAHHYKRTLANIIKFLCFSRKWNKANSSFKLEEKGLDLGKGQ